VLLGEAGSEKPVRPAAPRLAGFTLFGFIYAVASMALGASSFSLRPQLVLPLYVGSWFCRSFVFNNIVA
jgi:hypothetical protein